MAIRPDTHQFIADLVLREVAIVLDPSKSYVMEARLSPLLRSEHLQDLEDLVAQLRAGNSMLQAKVIDALTTNETFFFREVALFDELRKSVIPELMEKRKSIKTLNLWCAACSSGQEPYSIAMALRAYLPLLSGWRMNFIASDISDKVLQTAKDGSYNQIDINRGLPRDMLTRFFIKDGDKWKIKDEIKNMVEFRKVNLNGQFINFPKLDIIFIRNVLIYFSRDKKIEIFDKMSKILRPDGLVFLSATESAISVTNKFDLKRYPSISGYTLKDTHSQSSARQRA